MSKTFQGPDSLTRCGWSGAAPEFLSYHDMEWGFPISDDHQLFEKLSLESFQAGLSWRTILAKRENFRDAFSNFDFNIIAKFTDRDVTGLMNDTGIVRHRGKIEAVINNAARARELVADQGSLTAYVWGFEPVVEDTHAPQAASMSAASVALSKDLKRRGWKFVGPTTIYAFMQAVGLVNDHLHECCIRERVKLARLSFTRPVKSSG